MMWKSKFSQFLVNIFWWFFGCFTHPPTLSLTLIWISILKVFRWYISGRSFIYIWFVVIDFWNFKCFHTSRKLSRQCNIQIGRFWSIFGPNLPPKKKILPKTRIYPETTFLGLLSNTSFRSQINHRIVIKLIK